MRQDWLRLSQYSPTYNAAACGLLQRLWEPNPIQEFRAFGWPMEPTDTLEYFSPSVETTPVMHVSFDNFDVVFLEGTTAAPGQIARMIAGWTVPACNNSVTGANPFFERAASLLIDSIPAMKDENRILVLLGHSLGGCTAMTAVAMLRANGSGKRIFTSTYGSPRPGNQRFQQLFRNEGNFVRFFNHDDPVRYIPPHIDELSTWAVTVPASLADGVDTQVQVQNPWQVNDDGTIVSVSGEPSAITAVSYSVGGWCWSPEGFANGAHRSTIYRDRFANQVNHEGVLPGPPAKIKPPEPYNPTGAEYEKLKAAALERIRQALHNGTQPPVNVPVDQRYTPTSPRYRRRKRGGIWTVELEGDVVAVGPGKRSAGTLARRFNRARSANR